MSFNFSPGGSSSWQLHEVEEGWSKDLIHGFSLSGLKLFTKSADKTDLEIPRLEYGREFNKSLRLLGACVFNILF